MTSFGTRFGTKSGTKYKLRCENGYCWVQERQVPIESWKPSSCLVVSCSLRGYLYLFQNLTNWWTYYLSASSPHHSRDILDQIKRSLILIKCFFTKAYNGFKAISLDSAQPSNAVAELSFRMTFERPLLWFNVSEPLQWTVVGTDGRLCHLIRPPPISDLTGFIGRINGTRRW